MKRYWIGAAAPVTFLLCMTQALAQDQAPSDQAAPAAAPADMGPPGFKISGHIEAGITANPDDPEDSQNFGQLFTDKANQPLLNQALITAEQPLDPKATGYDFGFRVQALFGSDARFTGLVGELDQSIHDRNQVSIVEANVQAHLPLFFDGGIDTKLGQFATPLGYEVIDATGNPFYSHSYIFNFGIPLDHTGGYLTAHVDDTLDIYAGGTTGVNTALFDAGVGGPSFLGGFGLNNLLDGKLTVLALTHIGRADPNNTPQRGSLRYLNDIVSTYKASDTLSFTTELNYIRDDGFNAQAFGIAQYASYAFDDNFTFNARAEFFRDDNGFFVAAFPNPQSFVDVERGIPAAFISHGAASYGELTLGTAIKLDVPDGYPGVMVRPEFRLDHTLSDTRVFDSGTNTTQETLAIDAIVSF